MHFSKIYVLFTILMCILHAHSGNAAEAEPQETNKYVGVEACAPCHEDIVQTYRKNSGKAVSDKSLLKMREKLTDAEFRDCLKCHTTGYGEPSGFVSFEKTPHLGIVGCESCHGMGYLHTIEQSAESITKKPTLELCVTCHDDTRIKRINFDGRIHAGGH